MEIGADRLLIPYNEARHILGDLGRTKFHGLIDERELERVKIGRRAFITAKSLAAYVDGSASPHP